MLKIFNSTQAAQSILKRQKSKQKQYPEGLMKSVRTLFGPTATPESAVEEILESIANQGDTALTQWTKRIDKVELSEFKIPAIQLKEAFEQTPASLKDALYLAKSRIETFYRQQPIPSWETKNEEGRLGQRFTPIDRIGVYVPGGTAPLPSSLLMSVIPAQIAGVKEIIVCTPPNPDSSILAAAYLCNIENIYQLGGAQAIGAMAFGTQSIQAVDKIVGAGNLFVNLAKQQVYGIVGLDGLAGPTETIVIADESANPKWVAADLLAQAEHDILATAILLTPSEALAQAVQEEIASQFVECNRQDILRQSLSNQSGIVLTEDLSEAAQLSNQFAPEHLCLTVSDPAALAQQITHTGGIFFGEYSFEVLGDYVAGPSHVMPTGGTARFNSPLNVLDFVKLSSIIALNKDAGVALSSVAVKIATAEQLDAHAAAATFRLGGNQ